MAKKKRAKIERIKVLLVDDHPVVREGIRACLEPHPHIQVIGEASNGAEAVRKAKRLSPNVILMDISMPQMSGLEATKLLGKIVPKAKVLILTMHENKAYIMEIVRSGAKGYLLKDSPPSQLLSAIDAVNRGEAYFSTSISQMVLNEYVKKPKHLHKPGNPEISQREKEVLTLIAEGFSNKAIADKLSVSVRTVETHREHIMRKLDIHNTAGLTRYAISAGIIENSVQLTIV